MGSGGDKWRCDGCKQRSFCGCIGLWFVGFFPDLLEAIGSDSSYGDRGSADLLDVYRVMALVDVEEDGV